MDSQKRNWMVTTPWRDALPPSEENVPLLTAYNVRAKYSRKNESLTIVYRFDSTRYASYLSRAFTDEFVLISGATPNNLVAFDCIDHDWQFNYVKPSEDIDDDLPSAGHVQDTAPIGPTVGFFCITTERGRLKRIRDEITVLDNEIGAIAKRFRTECVDFLDL